MDSAATRQNIKQDVYFICRLAEGDVDLQHLLEVVRPLRYLYLANEFSDCSQPNMNITRIAHFVAKSRKPDVACSIGLDHSSTEILMAYCLQPDKNITRIVRFVAAQVLRVTCFHRHDEKDKSPIRPVKNTTNSQFAEM